MPHPYWKCLLCGKKYSTRKQAFAHIQQMHGSIQKRRQGARIRKPQHGVHYIRIDRNGEKWDRKKRTRKRWLSEVEMFDMRNGV